MSDIHDQEESSFSDEKFATKPSSEANGEGNGESQYPQGLKLAVIILSNMIAMFLVALDRTIITTAIPRITDDFHSLNNVSWYASAYLITSCATQLLWGRIFTFYSTKAIYLIAIFLFELGSLLCGVAPNSVAFIIGRAIAGAGSAGIYSGSTILITSVTPLHKRAGLPVGGVAVAALIALFPKLSPKESTPLKQQIRQLDPLGNLVFLPGVICLILALQWGGEKYPWNSGRIIALLVLAGVLLIIFVSIQIWQRENATVPPRLFAVRNIWLGAVFSFCLGAVLIVFLVALPIWFQGIRGTDAVTSGIDTLPLVLALVFGAMVSGAMINGIGWFNPVFYSSVIFMSVGGGLISTFGVHTPTHTWIGYQIILGLGVGQGMQLASLGAQVSLEQKDVPTGVSLMFFAQSLGGSVLVCVGQAVFNESLTSRLSRFPDLDVSRLAGQGVTHLRHIIPTDILEAVLGEYNAALRNYFYVGLAVACFAVVPSLGIEWKSVKGKTGH
ncbi:hypothetical protein COL922a_011354 [Colletotrichum nupharicola]|nr:hypothetical protein COL922a_011354 [Colletotrichum nupharicola]